jgi:RND family efflux transporter MFP subunit
VDFEEGAMVAKGDLLYTLDPRTFAAERDAARARVTEAEARLQLARSEAERVQGLIASRAVSREELEQRTREVDTAEASLLAARAALESAGLDLEFARVVAPVSGRAGRALVTEGNLVTGGSGNATVLTTIVSMDPIYFRFPIDEPTALRLRRVVDDSKNPIPVELQLTGRDDYEFRGRLDFLDNRIDEETGTLMVRAVFDNPGGGLVPGAFGRVRLQLDPPETRLLVPEKALGVDQTQQILMVVGDGDVVERRVVTTGPLADGWRVIRSGLEPGDRVVVDGLLSARPGSTVSPKALETAP